MPVPTRFLRYCTVHFTVGIWGQGALQTRKGTNAGTLQDAPSAAAHAASSARSPWPQLADQSPPLLSLGIMPPLRTIMASLLPPSSVAPVSSLSAAMRSLLPVPKAGQHGSLSAQTDESPSIMLGGATGSTASRCCPLDSVPTLRVMARPSVIAVCSSGVAGHVTGMISINHSSRSATVVIAPRLPSCLSPHCFWVGVGERKLIRRRRSRSPDASR